MVSALPVSLPVRPGASTTSVKQVLIVGFLAFNEQAEWQIKAAIIRWNPKLAGYPDGTDVCYICARSDEKIELKGGLSL